MIDLIFTFFIFFSFSFFLSLELESLAERELLAAAKVIEDAAKALMQAKNNQPKVEIGGTTNIANAILEAAMAVTKATGLLVQCATEAQRERIKLGLESGNPASYYKKNSWAQGLVSAAKAVAFATSQVSIYISFLKKQKKC